MILLRLLLSEAYASERETIATFRRLESWNGSPFVIETHFKKTPILVRKGFVVSIDAYVLTFFYAVAPTSTGVDESETLGRLYSPFLVNVKNYAYLYQP